MSRSTGTSDSASRGESARSVRGTPGPARAVVLLAAVLTITYLATQFTLIPGGADTDDMPEVMAEGGCFDIEVEPVEEEPPVSLSQAEEEVRAFLTDFDDEHGLPHELGSVRWAKYGKVVHGGYTDHPAPAVGQVRWVLVFESNERDWWSSLFGRRLPNRRTALFVPEVGAVSACSGFA